MGISINSLKFISPFKVLLNTGDVVQAETIKSYPTCSVVTDRHGNWHNKAGMYSEYQYLLNNNVITKNELKEFLKDKNKIQELEPDTPDTEIKKIKKQIMDRDKIINSDVTILDYKEDMGANNDGRLTISIKEFHGKKHEMITFLNWLGNQFINQGGLYAVDIIVPIKGKYRVYKSKSEKNMWINKMEEI